MGHRDFLECKVFRELVEDGSIHGREIRLRRLQRQGIDTHYSLFGRATLLRKTALEEDLDPMPPRSCYDPADFRADETYVYTCAQCYDSEEAPAKDDVRENPAQAFREGSGPEEAGQPFYGQPISQEPGGSHARAAYDTAHSQRQADLSGPTFMADPRDGHRRKSRQSDGHRGNRPPERKIYRVVVPAEGDGRRESQRETRRPKDSRRYRNNDHERVERPKRTTTTAYKPGDSGGVRSVSRRPRDDDPDERWRRRN